MNCDESGHLKRLPLIAPGSHWGRENYSLHCTQVRDGHDNPGLSAPSYVSYTGKDPPVLATNPREERTGRELAGPSFSGKTTVAVPGILSTPSCVFIPISRSIKPIPPFSRVSVTLPHMMRTSPGTSIARCSKRALPRPSPGQREVLQILGHYALFPGPVDENAGVLVVVEPEVQIVMYPVEVLDSGRSTGTSAWEWVCRCTWAIPCPHARLRRRSGPCSATGPRLGAHCGPRSPQRTFAGALPARWSLRYLSALGFAASEFIFGSMKPWVIHSSSSF